MAFVIKNNDGTVAIMQLAGEAALAAEMAPEEHLDGLVQAEINTWPEGVRSKVVSFRSMPDESLPTDLTFRDAWRDNGGEAIGVDTAVCREIWRDKMRVARAPKFRELDIAFQRALETGSDTT